MARPRAGRGCAGAAVAVVIARLAIVVASLGIEATWVRCGALGPRTAGPQQQESDDEYEHAHDQPPGAIRRGDPRAYFLPVKYGRQRAV